VVVANALPAGWSEGFIGGSGATRSAASLGFVKACYAPPLAAAGGWLAADADLDEMAVPPRSEGSSLVGRLLGRFKKSEPAERLDRLTARAPSVTEVRITVPAGRHPTGAEAVLFDSARDATADPLPVGVRLTSLSLTVRDGTVTADAVGPDLTILVFVGDMAAARARVRVADLLRHAGRRPLNLRREPGQEVRLVIDDPDGRWRAGVPALEVSLGWEG
jgi:Ca-activated chloride channel family protein